MHSLLNNPVEITISRGGALKTQANLGPDVSLGLQSWSRLDASDPRHSALVGLVMVVINWVPLRRLVPEDALALADYMRALTEILTDPSLPPSEVIDHWLLSLTALVAGAQIGGVTAPSITFKMEK